MSQPKSGNTISITFAADANFRIVPGASFTVETREGVTNKGENIEPTVLNLIKTNTGNTVLFGDDAENPEKQKSFNELIKTSNGTSAEGVNNVAANQPNNVAANQQNNASIEQSIGNAFGNALGAAADPHLKNVRKQFDNGTIEKIGHNYIDSGADNANKGIDYGTSFAHAHTQDGINAATNLATNGIEGTNQIFQAELNNFKVDPNAPWHERLAQRTARSVAGIGAKMATGVAKVAVTEGSKIAKKEAPNLINQISYHSKKNVDHIKDGAKNEVTSGVNKVKNSISQQQPQLPQQFSGGRKSKSARTRKTKRRRSTSKRRKSRR